MIIRIIGWAWLLLGIALFLFPQILRWRIQKKSKRIIRNYLFAFTAVLIAVFIKIWLKADGVWIKFIIIICVLLIVKLAFFVKSKFSQKISGFIRKQPVLFFRLMALAQSACGFFMILYAS
ncbi:MAG: hypothetical protein PHV77_01945 [Candidatus Omnitrophica bacterium]|nr:hypothetical protein [Candidatus Omnitrophota bacterium]